MFFFVSLQKMKLTGIISVILACIYSASTIVGIGVIRCGCTHSQRLVMLSFYPSCLCSSSDEDCCAHNENHHDDHVHEDFGCMDNDCCSLVYQYMDVDQLNVSYIHDYPTKNVTSLFFPLLSVDILMDNMQQCVATIKNNSPPGILKIPLIFMHRQLRL